jgi:hypothetical protein
MNGNKQYGFGFQREDFGPSLISAGLSMLANNNGRMNTAQLIGQGGLDALAGLQARKQYEAAMARQQMQDERAQAQHDLAMRQGQMQMDEQSQRAELMKRWQAGDMEAYKILFPEQWAADQRQAQAHRNALALEAFKQGGKGAPMPKLSDVNTTRGKFVTESGDYLSMGGSLKKILAGAKEGTGAGDLSVVFSYMKTLDPTSTVREGEFANAENSAGIPAKVTNIYNKLLNGERLTNKQRRDFVSMAKELFKAAEPAQAERVRQYTNLANQYGVSPDMIIYSPYNDLLGQVDEYLTSIPDEVAAPPVEVPGLTVTPSHGAPKIRKWNPEKGDFD